MQAMAQLKKAHEMQMIMQMVMQMIMQNKPKRTGINQRTL